MSMKSPSSTYCGESQLLGTSWLKNTKYLLQVLHYTSFTSIAVLARGGEKTTYPELRYICQQNPWCRSSYANWRGLLSTSLTVFSDRRFFSARMVAPLLWMMHLHLGCQHNYNQLKLHSADRLFPALSNKHTMLGTVIKVKGGTKNKIASITLDLWKSIV